MKRKIRFAAGALALSVCLGGCRGSVVTGERVEKQFRADEVSVIRVFEDVQGVRITSSKSDEISVIYHESDVKVYSVELNDGELVVRGESKKPAARVDKGFTEVVLPASFAGALYVEAGVGSCHISADGAFSEVQVKVATGEISVKKLCADRISLETGAGAVSGTIKGVKADYTVSARCAVGTCNLRNRQGADPGKRLDVDVVTGSVQLRFTEG